jgi:xylan 1,4-beta-xylosidase
MGLAAIGDADRAIGIAAAGGRVIVWRRNKAQQQTLAAANLPKTSAIVLRMTSREGKRYRFAYSADGHQWQQLGPEADGGYLPPWDLAVRVALSVGGPKGAQGRFDWIRIERHPIVAYPASRSRNLAGERLPAELDVTRRLRVEPRSSRE